MKSIQEQKRWTEDFSHAVTAYEDLLVLYEFFQAEEATETEVEQAYNQSLEMIEALEFRNMLSNEEDKLGCIVNINSGAGGTESQD